jgi:PEGA domain
MFAPTDHSTLSLRLIACLVLVGMMVLPGCVRRRLMVRSNPPGAMVYVDNQLIGTTPCATDFVYYGTREIRLVKAGYDTYTVNQPIPAPWYEIPPLDFVSENLTWKKIQDFRTVTYDLKPQTIVPTEQLLGRAEELRRSTLQGVILPGTTTTGVPGPILPPTPVVANPAAPISTAPETLGPATPVPSTPGTLPSSGQPLQPLP